MGRPRWPKCSSRTNSPGASSPRAHGGVVEREGCGRCLRRRDGSAGWLNGCGARGEWKESHGAVAIVVHSMFIDILTKVLTGCEMTTGSSRWCSARRTRGCTCSSSIPGRRIIRAHPGMPRRVLDHLPPEIRTGGSVEGLTTVT